MSVRMTVWVDDMDDLAEFIDQLPADTVPTLGRDDEGWHVAVDLCDGGEVLSGDPPAEEVAGAGDSPTAAVPAPAAAGELRSAVVDVLREGPATATEIAERTGVDRDAVLGALRSLCSAGTVESAGVKGWRLRRRQFDPDAARVRAAEAL